MLEYVQNTPILLAGAIFIARVLDVSIGTVRTILVIRSRRVLAAVLGFFEVLIWLLAAAQVIQNLEQWYLIVAYAGGFAAGNIFGIMIESRLAIGSELVRAVSENREVNLADSLRKIGYSITELPGEGDDGVPVEVLLIVEKRRKVPELLQTINEIDPKAFWTTSDIKGHPVMPAVARALTKAGKSK
jgi:uncharacterized protein YebE (UPF0316 family)